MFQEAEWAPTRPVPVGAGLLEERGVREPDEADVEEGTPAEIFGAPREERTRRFLQRIVEAGRL